MQSAQPKPADGNCYCGWGGCLGICFLTNQFDEDDSKLDAPPDKDSPESSAADEVLAMINNSREPDEFDAALKTIGFAEEEKSGNEDESFTLVARLNSTNPEQQTENGAATATMETPQAAEHFTERKRKKEKKRRNDINQGLNVLAKVIFLVDPEKEAQAREGHNGGDSTEAAAAAVESSKLLGRVELVNAAVATLARVHNDNEVHKALIAHLTSRKDASVEPDSAAAATTNEQLIPRTMVSPTPSSNETEGATKDDQADEVDDKSLSQSERKRNREKRRRSQIAKGMKALAEILFHIDPSIKAAAEERAKKIHAGGSTSTTTNQTQLLLSRVELVNCAAVIMFRIHKENEFNKMLIRTLAENASRGTSPESLPSTADGPAVPSSTAGQDASDEAKGRADSPKTSSNEPDTHNEPDDPQAFSSLLSTSPVDTTVETGDPTLLSSLIESVEFPAPVSFSSVSEILSPAKEQGPPPKRFKV